ncbi:MAG: sigma-70 family RNA polymerase sigma factor [Myxococcales bacterium]|nr:sigma-70 family RNA polymerase sigma factor [Myxococcales bacterium]
MWFWAIGPTNKEELTDEELMTRYQGGDTAALGVLYDRYAHRLKAFAYRKGAKRPDEVVQDAFMRIVRNGGSYKGTAKFKTWLFSIARNLTIDASRRDKFRNMPSLDAPIRSTEGSMTLGDRVATQEPHADAERAVTDRRFKAALEVALAELPEDQREVFLLRQYSGLSFKEIGATVGCKENTAKSRMRYALLALRDALAAYR